MMNHIHCQDARKKFPEYHLENWWVIDIARVSLFLEELRIELTSDCSLAFPPHLLCTGPGQPIVQAESEDS